MNTDCESDFVFIDSKGNSYQPVIKKTPVKEQSPVKEVKRKLPKLCFLSKKKKKPVEEVKENKEVIVVSPKQEDIPYWSWESQQPAVQVKELEPQKEIPLRQTYRFSVEQEMWIVLIFVVIMSIFLWLLS